MRQGWLKTGNPPELAQVNLPMLFLQGTRDALAEPPSLSSVIAQFGQRATLETGEQADHSFHVPAKPGRSDADVLGAMLDRVAAWPQKISDQVQ